MDYTCISLTYNVYLEHSSGCVQQALVGSLTQGASYIVIIAASTASLAPLCNLIKQCDIRPDSWVPLLFDFRGLLYNSTRFLAKSLYCGRLELDTGERHKFVELIALVCIPAGSVDTAAGTEAFAHGALAWFDG